MSSSWPAVRLGEVVTPIARSEIPVPGMTYRQLGVKLWGEGAYERETIDGSETRYAQLFRAEAGDIVVNKIWARNGSVAVVPESLAGCYGSGEFPMFAPQPAHLIARWIHWLSKTRQFWTQCDEKSRGTSGKNRIRPERFLEIELPLPPVSEQQRIVARIDELAEQIGAARTLHEQIKMQYAALLRSIVFNDKDCVLTPMNELVALRKADVPVEADKSYRFAGVYSFGRGVFSGPTKSGSEFAYKRLNRLRTCDFVYPKLMAWEGALAVVPSECNELFVSPEFMVFEVDQSRVLPETLDVYFRTPTVWPKLSGESTGTNVRRRRLHPDDFLAYKMPLPSMNAQKRLRAICAHHALMRPLQVQVLEELEALLPSILDRAFKGEL